MKHRGDLAEPAAGPQASGPSAPANRRRLGGLLPPPGDTTEDFVVEWQLAVSDPSRSDSSKAHSERTFWRKVPTGSP